MSTTLLLIVVTLVCFHHPPSKADILPDDTPLLKALRDSFINRTEAISNWFVPNTSPCNWTGIKCHGLLVNQIDLSLSPLNLPFPRLITEFKSLKYLNLSHCAFTGEVFPELWDLENLNVIDLSDNKLSGTIFPKIDYKLKYLRQLILDNNNFSGSLPSTIGHLTNLLELSLHSNSFSGNLPKEVGSLHLIQSLDISGNSFSGDLPRSLGNLTSLLFFSARQNVLTGPIPPEIGKLKNLQILDLSWNSFSGTVPEGVSNLSNLTYLNLSQNDFDGELLPSTIGQLLNLVYLVAANSGLKGPIPSGLGKCAKLRTLDLSFNLLDGPLPASLAGLVSIHSILLNTNRLSGRIPLWISNWKQVQSITISQNMFSGPLPALHLPSLSILDASANLLSGELSADICDGATSLTTLSLSRNNFSGSIGNGTFKDCQNLVELILSENNISGEIPGYLGKLGLINLELSKNKLSGKIPDQLWESETLMGISLDNNLLEDIPSELFDCTELVSVDLGGNRLTGQIPKSVSKLKLLDNLVLSGNKLSGQIPEEICSGFQMVPLPDSEFVQHYGLLDLSENELVGPIPSTIKHCIVLKELILHGNKLKGNIPEELASLANLTLLDLSSNSFSGPVFPKLFLMTSLQGLILAHNQLEGSIPDNILPAVSSLAKLDLSSNYLSGSLPLSIFSTKSLTYLNASNNRLSGPLDDDFVSNFESLSVLDLHNNKLDGRVPGSLSNLAELTYLDLSENNFRDYFPCNICTVQGLIFANFSGNSFAGPFPNSCADKIPCIIPSLSHASRFGINIAIVVAIFVFLILLLVGLLLRWKSQRRDGVLTIDKGKKAVMMSLEPTSSEGLLGKRKKIKEPLSINIATFEHSLLRIKASDIFFATENFSESYIIGDGGFGTVYRALLPGGRTIAVKRLNGGHLHGEREFLAEMETIGKVKHENLVPLLGYCVFADERFLIYQYMENGSLDFWLRNQADVVGPALDWPARFKICLGSARGLAFLHHGFVPHVIHRDIKSSNILLDRNFEARVSDFGLARIISACETHVSTMLAGTFGYIPPEYGQTMVATAKGDVYSFGVVMLELVTGRAPIGQTDVEGGNLVGWVRWMVANGRECEILDPCFSGSGVWKDQMVRVLCIARSCTEDEPWMRPSMLEVVKMLKQAKIA
ncbi:leucine-rich repeat receptor protein kinase exs [Phtheirospermum japonicum]|uniref:non-specific serine/threonine protein kinase n=1 Tax=Phtheirospermum japonicum TaxID=374723 RepID=A0A830C512_9LAMI|nr:leucine-rich repeat receptor protein kinase exs [Phtheirospermum japonicum]